MKWLKENERVFESVCFGYMGIRSRNLKARSETLGAVGQDGLTFVCYTNQTDFSVKYLRYCWRP